MNVGAIINRPEMLEKNSFLSDMKEENI